MEAILDQKDHVEALKDETLMLISQPNTITKDQEDK